MMGALAGAALSLTLTASHRADAGPPPASSSPADANQPEHPLHITADHLTVLTKENKTQWTGKVHVVRPPENGQPPVDIRCQVMKTTATAAADAPDTVMSIARVISPLASRRSAYRICDQWCSHANLGFGCGR